MALPHMPSLYTTRKNIYEAAIVRRRTQETDYRDKWQGTASYFNAAEVKSSKDALWTSKATFESSMDAYKKNYTKDTKALSLAKRQSRLTSLLHEESKQYEAELKGYSPENYDRISEMKERSEALKSAREEERKQIAQEKLYEHFKENCPDIRGMVAKQHQDHVIGKWSEQKAERLQALEEEKRQKKEMEDRLEADRLAAVERQRQIEQQRLDNEMKLRDNLRLQMSELQKREKEAEMLKKQQESLLRSQWELEKLEDERRLLEEERKKQELGRILLRQHAAALRRKQKQVMEELEQDRKLLEDLIQKEAEEVALETARKERAKADAAWMKEVIEDQLRLEKEREAELDMLYQEEAARIWSQREDQWAREREARKRLMQEVLSERQSQIQHKMELIRKKQQESLERREELIRDIEQANQLTQRQKQETQRQKEVRAEELGAQITARQEKQVRDLEGEIQRIEDEKKAELEYEELLKLEAERLRIAGYQPQIHSKRGKSAWQ